MVSNLKKIHSITKSNIIFVPNIYLKFEKYMKCAVQPKYDAQYSLEQKQKV